ncbi:MAG TPA: alpha/beta hydrolase [Stellaceae bacterium]|nr:alpha/beta hydrolase [Stellaceae bacterium]
MSSIPWPSVVPLRNPLTSRIRQTAAAALLAAGAVALGTVGAVAAGTTVDLPASDGGKQRVLYLPAGNPSAALIMFPGGNGVVKLSSDGNFGAGGNFLVRTRELWVQQGMAVAIPDVPTNRSSLFNYRTTADYADDVGKIVAYVRTQTKAPIWLVGTSQGTNAAVGAASRLTHGEIAGVVLTSTLTREGAKPDLKETVFKANLAAINVPVLILSHSGDKCDITPPGDAERVKAALKASPKVEIVMVSGGLPPQSPPCEARAEHGFLGIEPEVVARIAGWIKSNTK